jgi:translation initiation factor IF-1
MFGFKLAELTGQNESAGVGLLCLAIKDAGKTIQDMNYQDYKNVFENHLPQRMEKMKIANKDQIIAELLKILNEKQSVFTMSAH